jgi:hypothetical protein
MFRQSHVVTTLVWKNGWQLIEKITWFITDYAITQTRYGTRKSGVREFMPVSKEPVNKAKNANILSRGLKKE